MKICKRRHRGGVMVQVLVAIAVLALAIAWLIPFISRARDRAAMAACQDNLRRLGAALTRYASANEGNFPVVSTIQNPQKQLIQSLSPYLKDPHDFYCPAEKNTSLIYTPSHFLDGIINYYYYSALAPGDAQPLGKLLRSEVSWPRNLTTQSPPRTWIMSDIWRRGEPTAHNASRKGMNYLMLDGSVASVAEMPRQAFK